MAVAHAPTPSPGFAYRPDLDGLRGIAILAVVGFHAFPVLFPGGYLGVDIFFVLSGFLISSLLIEQLRRSTFSLRGFYLRRMRRLFPALVVVVSACLLFGWYALLPDELHLLGKHVAAAAVFYLNVTLAHEGGYFDAASALKPLMHLWSLSVEEQFYLLWPLALVLLWRRTTKPQLIIGVLVATSFSLGLLLARRDPRAEFYLPLSRFWELGLGCLLGTSSERARAGLSMVVHASARAQALRQCARSVLPVAGLMLILTAIFCFDGRKLAHAYAAVAPVAGTLCMIAAPAEGWLRRRVLASGVLVFIGLISYPLYLWHWPILSFATILGSGNLPNDVRWLAVLLSFVLACAVLWSVERPIRARRSHQVYVALSGSLLALCLAGVVVQSVAAVSHQLDPEITALERGPAVDATCAAEFPRQRQFNYCRSTSSLTPAVLVMGDSRAQAVYEGTAALIGRRYPLMLLGRGGCPPLRKVRVLESDHPETTSCTETWDALVRYVREFKPQVVVLVGSGASYLNDDGIRMAKRGAGTVGKDTVFEAGLKDLVAALDGTSRVIYVRQIPAFETPPSCFVRRIRVWWDRCQPTVARGAVEAHMAPYNRVVDQVAQQVPDLRVVDSIPALCGPNACSQKLRSGEIAYRDNIHLNVTGGRRFARASGLSEAIVQAMHPSAARETSTPYRRVRPRSWQ